MVGVCLKGVWRGVEGDGDAVKVDWLARCLRTARRPHQVRRPSWNKSPTPVCQHHRISQRNIPFFNAMTHVISDHGQNDTSTRQTRYASSQTLAQR